MRWLAILCFLALPVTADPLEVDVELFLAVDVSRSMSPAELEIQRRGYAEALRSDDVVEAITGGLIGKIALTYVEWAGPASQREIVPWTIVDSHEAAVAVSERLALAFNPAMRRTSISGVIDYAHKDIAENDVHGLRRVIDISGDGPNNQGLPVRLARDRALQDGIIINGLPLMTHDGIDAFGRGFHLDRLDIYYRTCVIGGPGAFVIPVLDWEEFAQAVRRKLVLEIAGLPGPRVQAEVFRIQSASHDPTDCMIGEKLWRERQRYWGQP
ncbi:MAG: DUF1194 domain-containing protein [Pseudomonadota bacterium]